jgi:pyruvate/2-oxoglutarate dehydrogenase complex dihydrolipoamide acyltransferase (E2) component
MPAIPIIMPQLGESIAEATIVNLLVPVGDHVKTDQDIIEVETSKATMNVASPCPGCVTQFRVKVGESYPVGAVLGYLEASPEDGAAGPGCSSCHERRGKRGRPRSLAQN